jgi:hypothetical protein
MAIAQLTSRIDSVKVYAAGATITRVADIQLDRGDAAEHVEIAGLPLALDDTSVRVRVEADGGTTAAIATDVRVGLAVPPRQKTTKPPIEEEVRDAENNVQRLEDAIALIENEINILYQLYVPKRPDGEPGKAPPPSPIGARLVLANFKDEQVRDRIQQRRETQEKLRQAQEHLEDLLSKQSRASTVREVRPHELRKTVIVRLSYEGEASAIVEQRLIVEYFVPGARWTPTYVCRVDSAGNKATIAVRALICQRTGEDWSGVRLELSTAEPMAWCELPELPSLRLGRAQSVMRKSGWRLPPIGAEILFEDFERHKERALSAMRQESALTDLFSPEVPPLPYIMRQSESSVKVSTQSFEFPELLEPQSDFNQMEREMLIRTLREAQRKAEEQEQAKEDLQRQFISLLDNVERAARGDLTDSAQSEVTADVLGAVGDSFNLVIQNQRELLQEIQQGKLPDITRFRLPPKPAPASQPGLTFLHEAKSDLTKSNSSAFLDEFDVFDDDLGNIPDFDLEKLPDDKLTEMALLDYGLMRLGAADDLTKRGKLSIEQRHEAYLEILKRRKVVVTFNVMEVVQQAVTNSQNCISVKLPPGGINVREIAGSFDYAYSADGRIDVPSDGEFHSVALTSSSTNVNLRYVVVPCEDTNVFRIAQLKNPLQAPLLAGPADVYVDGEYILSTNVATVPPKGQMELGLGVEQAIKVARNTTYQEVRSSKSLVAFNELRHEITIDIANRLPREVRIEVRERTPVPDENAKVDVQIDRVSPDWEKYEQEERDAPIQGGYRWRVQVPARRQITLSTQYTIKTFVDSEIIGGNRRE